MRNELWDSVIFKSHTKFQHYYLSTGNVKAEVWNACAAGIFFLVADGNLGILSCLWSLVVRGSAI